MPPVTPLTVLLTRAGAAGVFVGDAREHRPAPPGLWVGRRARAAVFDDPGAPPPPPEPALLFRVSAAGAETLHAAPLRPGCRLALWVEVTAGGSTAWAHASGTVVACEPGGSGRLAFAVRTRLDPPRTTD